MIINSLAFAEDRNQFTWVYVFWNTVQSVAGVTEGTFGLVVREVLVFDDEPTTDVAEAVTSFADH